MTQIAALLDQDAAFARTAQQWMDRLHPSMYQAFGEAASLYMFMSHAFVNADQINLHHDAVFRASMELAVPMRDLLAQIVAGEDHPIVMQASEHAASAARILVPGMVFLLLWR
jgi:hypothetical protein